MDNNLKMFIIGMLAVAIAYSIITFLNYSKEYTKEIKNEKVNHALDRLDKIIRRTVGAANQVIVNNAKDDGTFTPSFGKKVRDEVFETILKVLGDEGKQLLNESLGDLDKYISDGIEDEVDRRK